MEHSIIFFVMTRKFQSGISIGMTLCGGCRWSTGAVLGAVAVLLAGGGVSFTVIGAMPASASDDASCGTARTHLIVVGAGLLASSVLCTAAVLALVLSSAERAAYLASSPRWQGDRLLGKLMSVLMPLSPDDDEPTEARTAPRCVRWQVQFAALISAAACVLPALLCGAPFIIVWEVSALLAVAEAGCDAGSLPGVALSAAVYAVVPLVAGFGVLVCVLGIIVGALALARWPAFCTPPLPDLTLPDAADEGALKTRARAVRFVAISDTHGALSARETAALPSGDVLVHCGDFTKNGSVAEIAQFNAWLSTLPHATKIVIGGNHDLAADEHALYAANRALMRAHHHYAHLASDPEVAGAGDADEGDTEHEKRSGCCCGVGWITALIFSPKSSDAVPYSLALADDDGAAACGREAMRALFTNALYLAGEQCVTPGGASVFGAPWQPAIPTDETPEADRHPMAAFVRSPLQRAALWAATPQHLDVLLTHAPPRGVLDALLSDASHVGCTLLAERLAELARDDAAPQFHIFGHIHEARGVQFGAILGAAATHVDDTTFVNAASVNFAYALRPQYGAIAFDVVPRAVLSATAAAGGGGGDPDAQRAACFARAAESAAATGRVQLVALGDAEEGGVVATAAATTAATAAARSE